jgi:cytochrome c oxidase subunit II
MDSARQRLENFQTMTCINCHSIRGVSVAANAAPDLTHLAGRKSWAAGVLSNTNESIPLAEKSPGHQAGLLMPDLKLTDAQAGALAELFGDPQMSEAASIFHRD